MSSYFANLQMAVHLKRDHGWTWTRLKAEFSGMGSHFWEEVRYRLDAKDRLEAEDE